MGAEQPESTHFRLEKYSPTNQESEAGDQRSDIRGQRSKVRDQGSKTGDAQALRFSRLFGAFLRSPCLCYG
jgi:hypothetical protein